MSDPLVYDKAKYHYNGNYPKDLKNDQAFVITGIYLGWLIANGLVSDEFIEESQNSIGQFRSRSKTPVEIYKEWDGCLDDSMLNKEGNEFSQYYFDFKKGNYLRDYETTLAQNLPSLYHTEFTWGAFDKMSTVINDRYIKWKNGVNKKWWEFWK